MPGRFHPGLREFQGSLYLETKVTFFKKNRFFKSPKHVESYQLQLPWEGSTVFRNQPCLFPLCDRDSENPCQHRHWQMGSGSYLMGFLQTQ